MLRRDSDKTISTKTDANSWYRSLRGAGMMAQRARLPQMAAALSFRTIFGLLPVLLVAIIVLKVVSKPEHLEALIRQGLDQTGISAIAVKDEETLTLPEGWEFVAQDDQIVAPPPKDAAGSTAKRLDDWIKQLINRIENISIPALGLIGLAALIYTALGMLIEIERAFNQIYRAPRGRSWVKRLLLYWTLLTLGPCGLFATFYIGNRARNFTEELVQSTQGVVGDFSTFGVVAVGYIFTVLISGSVLLLLYMAVPNTRVKFRPALIGATMAAIAWEAGKWGFAQYIEFTRGASYVRLYGSIALIPLFLLWVYVTWLIVLTGLFVSYRMQYRRRADPLLLESDPNLNLLDPTQAPVIMACIARKFAQARSASLEEICSECSLASTPTLTLLERLIRAGLVNVVMMHKLPVTPTHDALNAAEPHTAEQKQSKFEAQAQRDSEVMPPESVAESDSSSGHDADDSQQLKPSAGYALAAPAESIKVRDILAAAFGSQAVAASGSSSHLSDKLRQAQLDVVGESTLESLVK